MTQTTSTIRITVNGAAVVNADDLAQQVAAGASWMPRINRLDLGCGPKPSFGSFLIDREDWDSLFDEAEVEAFDIVLERDDGETGDPQTVTLLNYVVVSAHAAMRLENSPMVLEVADIRYSLKNKVSVRRWNVEPETGKTWTNVLNDLKSDLPSTFVGDLSFATTPSYNPKNLKYEGWPTLEALADVGYRTGHVLVYDPIGGSLKFENMTGEQSGLYAGYSTIAELLDSSDLFRPFETPPTDYTDEVGTVTVLFSDKSTGRTYSTNIDNPSSSSQNVRFAYGTRLAILNPDGTASNESELLIEANPLAQTWFDWSERKRTRDCSEFIGILKVVCGSQVSFVSWRATGSELFTTVDKWAPPEPITKRQFVEFQSQRTIRVKNMSNRVVPPWGFLQINGVVTTPTADLDSFQNNPVFTGIGPNKSGWSQKRIVSVPSGANPSETVDCIIDGPVPARINSNQFGNPSSCSAHDLDLVDDDDITEMNCEFRQANFGFPVLYREQGTGQKWGLIDMNPNVGPIAMWLDRDSSYYQFSNSTQFFGFPFGNNSSGARLSYPPGRIRATPQYLQLDGLTHCVGVVQVLCQFTLPGEPVPGTSLRKFAGVDAWCNLIAGATTNLAVYPGSLTRPHFLFPSVVSSELTMTVSHTFTHSFVIHTQAEGQFETLFAQCRLNAGCNKVGGVSGSITAELRPLSFWIMETEPINEPSPGPVSQTGPASMAIFGTGGDPISLMSSKVKPAQIKLGSGGSGKSSGFGAGFE